MLCRLTSSLPPQHENSNRGVEWETWLVGLQHKLLLGVAPKDGTSTLAAKNKGDSGNRACGCRAGKKQQRSAGCKRCGGSRYLYRMVAAVADISERVSSGKQCCRKTRYLLPYYNLGCRQPGILRAFSSSSCTAVASTHVTNARLSFSSRLPLGLQHSLLSHHQSHRLADGPDGRCVLLIPALLWHFMTHDAHFVPGTHTHMQSSETHL